MRYLSPNSLHSIDIPVIVGSEYAVPTTDGKFTYRVGGVTSEIIVPKVDATEVSVEITTPPVASGELKIINSELTISTNIGMFRTRQMFGVVDLLDIPVQAEDVREILGVTAAELGDEEMSLEGVYLDLHKLLINNFHTLRQTDDYLNKKFGDFIAIVTALKAAPQLFIKLDKKRTTENGDFQRLADAKHFESYLSNLSGKLYAVKDELKDYLEPTSTVLISVLEIGIGTQWSVNK